MNGIVDASQKQMPFRYAFDHDTAIHSRLRKKKHVKLPAFAYPSWCGRSASGVSAGYSVLIVQGSMGMPGLHGHG
jgi:hypothetical protein